MRLLLTAFFISVLTVLAAPEKSWAKKCYTVAYPYEIKAAEAFLSVFEEMYSNIGHCAKMVAMPYNRAYSLLETGEIDANMTRVKIAFEDNPNFIHVKTPLASIDTYYLGYQDKIERLEQTPPEDSSNLTIGYMSTNIWAKKIAEKMSKNPLAVKSYEQLIALHNKGRVDVLLIDGFSFKALVKTNALNTTIFKRKYAGSYPLYHVLHKDHADIAEMLDQEAQKLSNTGRIEDIFNQLISKQDAYYLKFSDTGSKARYPFTIGVNQSPEKTLLTETIKIILAKLDIIPKRFDVHATNRVQALKDGHIDFIVFSPSWMKDNEPFQHTIFSDPIYEISDSVVCDKSQNITTHKDLYQTYTGTVAGYSYFDDAFLKRKDYANEKELIKALEAGEVSCGILGTRSFANYAKNNKTRLHATLTHSTGTLNLLIREEKKDIINDINNVIANLKRQKLFDVLLNDHVSRQNK